MRISESFPTLTSWGFGYDVCLIESVGLVHNEIHHYGSWRGIANGTEGGFWGGLRSK